MATVELTAIPTLATDAKPESSLAGSNSYGRAMGNTVTKADAAARFVLNHHARIHETIIALGYAGNYLIRVGFHCGHEHASLSGKQLRDESVIIVLESEIRKSTRCLAEALEGFLSKTAFTFTFYTPTRSLCLPCEPKWMEHDRWVSGMLSFPRIGRFYNWAVRRRSTGEGSSSNPTQALGTQKQPETQQSHGSANRQLTEEADKYNNVTASTAPDLHPGGVNGSFRINWKQLFVDSRVAFQLSHPPFSLNLELEATAWASRNKNGTDHPFPGQLQHRLHGAWSAVDIHTMSVYLQEQDTSNYFLGSVTTKIGSKPFDIESLRLRSGTPTPPREVEMTPTTHAKGKTISISTGVPHLPVAASTTLSDYRHTKMSYDQWRYDGGTDSDIDPRESEDQQAIRGAKTFATFTFTQTTTPAHFPEVSKQLEPGPLALLDYYPATALDHDSSIYVEVVSHWRSLPPKWKDRKKWVLDHFSSGPSQPLHLDIVGTSMFKIDLARLPVVSEPTATVTNEAEVAIDNAKLYHGENQTIYRGRHSMNGEIEVCFGVAIHRKIVAKERKQNWFKSLFGRVGKQRNSVEASGPPHL